MASDVHGESAVSMSGTHDDEKLSGTDDLDTHDISGKGADGEHRSTVSALEVELKDLREGYFQLSLKYAGVEAQREELVMKLNSTNDRRRWFA
ncbi:hypothetical protein Ancab_023602 [Ancistrocladus abbreviatus]